MQSDRFETFIDAILAIMMTVMVLKIPQPESMTFTGIWNLKIMYFGYFLSFIVLFSIWDHHRKLFTIVETINNKVVWIYSFLIFVITLVPFFTAWVVHYPNETIPEVMFGLIFLLVNILYVLSTEVTMKNDVHNTNELKYTELFIINLILFIIGFIIVLYGGYPIIMMIICLMTLLTWNIIPYVKKTYHIGE